MNCQCTCTIDEVLRTKKKRKNKNQRTYETTRKIKRIQTLKTSHNFVHLRWLSRIHRWIISLCCCANAVNIDVCVKFENSNIKNITPACVDDRQWTLEHEQRAIEFIHSLTHINSCARVRSLAERTTNDEGFRFNLSKSRVYTFSQLKFERMQNTELSEHVWVSHTHETVENRLENRTNDDGGGGGKKKHTTFGRHGTHGTK